MKKEIDFSAIINLDDLYQHLKTTLSLPDYFGNNLDALYDVISGEVKLPLHLVFINMQLEQLEQFENLIEFFESLEKEIKDFSFSYALKTHHDKDQNNNVL